MSKRKKRTSLTVKWPHNKRWVLDVVLEIVERKQRLGFSSSVSLEISRIVENYLTGAAVGRNFDSVVMKFVFEDAVNAHRPVNHNDVETENT